jgi:putative Mg2+ transporter-C (MgtC) family protein
MRWLTGNWHDLLPQPWACAVLVVVAVICGGILGVERERKQKAVGFRTLALVSLGSTVFTMVSASLGHRTPIAGQIVSGIGFLGAGVILRGPFGITGLTSAATIWAMAAVGMTVGMGYAGAGLALSVFLLATMLVLSLFEQRYIGPCRYRWALLTFREGGGKSLIKIEEVLDEYGFPRTNRQVLTLLPPTAGQPSSLGQMRLHYCDAHRHHREFLAFLAGMTEVEEIQREPVDVALSLRRRQARPM